MLITASQIQWTTDVTKALTTNKERDDCSALKSLKKKQVCQSKACEMFAASVSSQPFR